nr:uncharacterized protein LOC8283242 isoform X1 [Ipomoea trifida]
MDPPSNHPQLHPRRPKKRCITVENFYANCTLVPIQGSDGDYTVDIIKIEEQELLFLPPEDKDSRLYGWKVEIRERANGCHDKFYTHIRSGIRCRSAPEVKHYILHGRPRDENAKKPRRAPKKNRSEEDESNTTDSHHAENEMLNEALENERAALITSLGGNKEKGIVIHEEPAGLQNNKVSSGNLSLEGKGKGILIEENVHSGKFSSKPYICANFQNPTIMQSAGWSMVGMKGTSFGSSNPDNHHPCKTYAMKSFETNGQHLSPNTFEKPVNMDMDNGSLFDDVMPSEAEMEELMDFINSDLEEKEKVVDAVQGDVTDFDEIFGDIMEEIEKEKEKEVDAVQGNETDLAEIFDDITQEVEKENEKEVDAVQGDETDFAEIFGDIMEEIEKEKEKEVDAVQRDETDLAEIFGDIMDDGPIVDSFYEKYWRD